jgi:hypothetical protein
VHSGKIVKDLREGGLAFDLLLGRFREARLGRYEFNPPVLPSECSQCPESKVLTGIGESIRIGDIL